MPTTITNSIGTGGAYTTPQAWEDAAPADLTVADQIWRGELKNENFTSADTVLNITGSTSDATRYKHLVCESGAGWKDNIGTNPLRYDSTYGATIRKTGGYGSSSVIVAESYAKIEGIQMFAPEVSGNGERYALTMQNTTAEAIDCIAESNNLLGVIEARGGILKNCLVISAKSGASAIVRASSSGAFSLYNCTLVGYSDLAVNVSSGLYRGYNAFTVQNTAVFGVTNDNAGNGGSISATTCATSDTTPNAGFTGSLTYADQFVNTTIASADFRLKTGADLIDAGTTDATNAPNDIFGTARPIGASYDIGVHEFGAVSDTTPDAFSFTDVIDQATNSVIVSNTVTVTGIDASTPISITGGEYSINAGAFTSAAGNVVVNDTVQIRQTSSASNSTLTSATLDIGGVTDQWDVTTIAAAAGTITTEPLKNNTGTLLASETGVIVDIYSTTTGALILHTTGETTDASGILTLTDAAIVQATAYTVVIRLSSNALGIDQITAT